MCGKVLSLQPGHGEKQHHDVKGSNRDKPNRVMDGGLGKQQQTANTVIRNVFLYFNYGSVYCLSLFPKGISDYYIFYV